MPELEELEAYRKNNVLVSEGTVDLTLKLHSPAPVGWLDHALNLPVAPVTLKLELPSVGDDHLTRNVAYRPARIASDTASLPGAIV
jgi:hypothetical protein